MRRLSLEGRLAGLFALVLAAGVLAGMIARAYVPSAELVPGAALVLGAALALGALPFRWLARRATRPVRRMARALHGAVTSYREGDFNFSMPADRHDELGELVAAHNALGQALRDQRRQLAERELLLDTVIQNSPVAVLLIDSGQRVVFGNLAARQLLNEGRSLNGSRFGALIARCPQSLRAAVEAGTDSLFTVDGGNGEESYHLAQRRFTLRGRPHRLLLLKRLTRELSRQEVAAWKKLIRVLSHELNNSLGPISSLAHTGAEMLRRESYANLDEVFRTISERVRHLHAFIDSYATIARLPAPRPQSVEWKTFVDSLAVSCGFRPPRRWPERPGWFDPAQMSQALINLLKNAVEAGSPPESVELAIEEASDKVTISVSDRGRGMSSAVLANALLPFYSTKRNGAGLGLALAREIVEAHGGALSLNNREGGGLCVHIALPSRSDTAEPSPREI